MSAILLTGIATLDIVNHVKDYPAENDEVRSLDQHIRRGGNAANTAEVLSQLGHNVTLNCMLAKDHSAQFIMHDLQQKNINLHASIDVATSATPTSYITLNQSNGSRTIVHHRNLAELSFSHFDQIDLSCFNWFHFEGRNIEHTYMMMEKAKSSHLSISLEIEKTRTDGDIFTLLPLADVLLFSRPFVLSQGFNNAIHFLQYFSAKFSDKIISCTWGDEGAWLIKSGHVYHSPACTTNTAIDTLGAGDTYNAALIDALIHHHSLDECVHAACKLAGIKCQQSGFSNLLTHRDKN